MGRNSEAAGAYFFFAGFRVWVAAFFFAQYAFIRSLWALREAADRRRLLRTGAAAAVPFALGGGITGLSWERRSAISVSSAAFLASKVTRASSIRRLSMCPPGVGTANPLRLHMFPRTLREVL